MFWFPHKKLSHHRLKVMNNERFLDFMLQTNSLSPFAPEAFCREIRSLCEISLAHFPFSFYIVSFHVRRPPPLSPFRIQYLLLAENPLKTSTLLCTFCVVYGSLSNSLHLRRFLCKWSLTMQHCFASLFSYFDAGKGEWYIHQCNFE